MKKTTAPFFDLGPGALASSAHASVTFSTFVHGSDINSLLGQQNTIGFTYAGNKFVGSVYFGSNNFQLYSTDLTGGNVALFGSAMSGTPGETVLGASLGQSGFAAGDIYASPADGNIYHYVNSGGSPTLFSTMPDGSVVRQIFFDPGSTFGGNMLVSTSGGHIYSINSSGTVSLIATLGVDLEGLDIAATGFGPLGGDLLVTSEQTNTLYAIDSSTFAVSTVLSGLSLAETVSVVPLNLGSSGNPLEGFYVANYPVDVQKASYLDFTSYLGDAIVTQKASSGSAIGTLAGTARFSSLRKSARCPISRKTASSSRLNEFQS